MKRNNKGFSAVEGIMLLVIVGLIAGAGIYVWQAQHQASKLYSTSNTTAPAPSNNLVRKLSWKAAPKDLQQGILAIWDSKVPGWQTDPMCTQSLTPNNPEYNLYEVNDKYAEAGLYCDSGAATLYVKVNGTWQDVQSTQSGFSCDVISKYNIPKSLIGRSYPDGPVCFTSEGQQKNL
jgi:type II secretory pathway pseudopilin PulG